MISKFRISPKYFSNISKTKPIFAKNIESKGNVYYCIDIHTYMNAHNTDQYQYIQLNRNAYNTTGRNTEAHKEEFELFKRGS